MTTKEFTTEKEVRDSIRESGLDFSGYADSKIWYLLPLGTVLHGRRVKGEKIKSYRVEESELGGVTLRYVTEEGNDCGVQVENERFH